MRFSERLLCLSGISSIMKSLWNTYFYLLGLVQIFAVRPWAEFPDCVSIVPFKNIFSKATQQSQIHQISAFSPPEIRWRQITCGFYPSTWIFVQIKLFWSCIWAWNKSIKDGMHREEEGVLVSEPTTNTWRGSLCPQVWLENVTRQLNPCSTYSN